MKKTTYNISDIKKLAHQLGGTCLSKTYKNSTTKLKFKCSEGHHFRSSFITIKLGHWCSRCSHKRTAEKLRGNITEMVTIARQRGGICLSKVYINSATKLDWQCSKGHVWQATPSKVKYGSWCMQCAGIAPLTIEKMQEISKARGGKCLSKKYINGRTKLWWKCGNGHKKWAAVPENVKNGSWCPDCSEGLGERICRLFFEVLFKEKFTSSWPSWLKNRRGEGLQLDGYSEKLGLAFEHDGQQHYRYIQFFHQNKRLYKQRLLDDKIKDELCKANGVTLIRIRAVPTVVKIEDLKKVISDQCRNAGFPLPSEYEKIEVDLTKAYKPDSRTVEYKKYVEVRHGQLLSKSYLGSQVKLWHRCEAGHKFEMRPDSVKQGQWCPTCARPLPITLNDMKALARERGGRCLSKNVIDTQTPLWWECDKKHPKWLAPPSRIKAGGWCFRCARIAIGKSKRLNIDKMQELARNRGGVCLSKKYMKNNKKLFWQCDKGHLPWKATPGSIQTGNWCPKCGLIRREQKRKEMGGWPGAVARQINWMSYHEAKEFISKLDLKSQTEWRKWVKGSFSKLPQRPKDIPANPDKIYKNNGWISMGDWLGTGRIADQLKKYRDFQAAREWAHSLKLKGEGEWRLYLQGKVMSLPVKPNDIPASPNNTYKNSGWSGWGDWLGTGNKFTHQINYRSFIQAREFVRNLDLRSRNDWNMFCNGQIDGKIDKPDDIPRTPWSVYRNKGWIGMNDWLKK